MSTKSRRPTTAKKETTTTAVAEEQLDAQTDAVDQEVETVEPVQEPDVEQVQEVEEVEPAAEPVVSIDNGVQVTNLSVEVNHEEANYLNLPKEIRDAQASKQIIDAPTNTQIRPPMNPFMVMEEERRKQTATSNVPTLNEMTILLTEKGFPLDSVYALSSLHSNLAQYVSDMAPNNPKSPDEGARHQSALASVFFTALGSAPDVALESLRLIEVYFQTYNNHALARSHVFRFMDVVRLNANHLRAFQSLLHLFVELGSPDGRNHQQIAREVNLTQIADALSENTDVQARLVEFMAK